MNNKLIFIALSLVLSLTLSACGETAADKLAADQKKATDEAVAGVQDILANPPVIKIDKQKKAANP